MSVSLTMKPPYILAIPSSSLQELRSATNTGIILEVLQVNSSTTGIAVGDIVYYSQNVDSIIIDTKDSTNYYIVDESKIMFIEI
jgi:hypothetical protein